MKELILYPLFISLVLSCSELNHTSENTKKSVSLSLIVDVTDPLQYRPTADKLLALYQFNQNPQSEGFFRLRTISDKRFTPLVSFRLADGASMEKNNKNQDMQFRNKNIVAFYKTVRRTMAEFYRIVDTTASLSNSECFRTISDELSYLTKVDGRRILVIASDLMERSDFLNCYSEDLSNHEAISERLAKANFLPTNLSGITVILLYQSKDRREDHAFAAMAHVYRQLLLSKGAEVKILANL